MLTGQYITKNLEKKLCFCLNSPWLKTGNEGIVLLHNVGNSLSVDM
jgi:hypothetical protein